MREFSGRKKRGPAILRPLLVFLCLVSHPVSAREEEDKEPEPPVAAPMESAHASVVVISRPAPNPPASLLGEPRTRGFLGYGFLITADGCVATCDSVLPENLPDNRVYLTDVHGETYWGEILKRDSFSGFAILRMKLPDLRLRISLLKLSSLRTSDDEVVLLRSPVTTATPCEPAKLAGPENENDAMSVLRLDTNLLSRAEGFPVVDKEGLLVGIAGEKSGFPCADDLNPSNEEPSGASAGAETPKGIAIDELTVVPGKRLLDFVNDWLEEEKNRILQLPAEFATGEEDPDNPFLIVPRIPSGEELEKPFGLGIAGLDETLASELGLGEGATGIVITGVEPESPAARAGLTRGLVIFQIGSYEISTLDDISEFAQNMRSQELTEFVVGKESALAENVTMISMSRIFLSSR